MNVCSWGFYGIECMRKCTKAVQKQPKGSSTMQYRNKDINENTIGNRSMHIKKRTGIIFVCSALKCYN